MNRALWDYSLGYGLDGERIAQAWHLGTREVKRKGRYFDFKFYVECEQWDGARWKPSGIQTTQADYWEFVLGRSGIVVAIPTAALRAAVHNERGQVKQARNEEDIPTNGRVVALADLAGLWEVA